MPIGNIVANILNTRAKTTMGNYSVIGMPFVQQYTSQSSRALDKSTSKFMSKIIPGGQLSIGNVNFGSPLDLISQFGGGAGLIFRELGNTAADGLEGIPDGYKISITAKQNEREVVSVKGATLQDRVSMKVSSEWEPFIPLGAIGQSVNAISQAVGGVAILSRFMTRRIWKGTSPVEITLHLLFNSITDARNDVMDPVMGLLQLAAPSDGGKAGGLPFLNPPGPSPFLITDEQQQGGVFKTLNAVSGGIAKRMADKLNTGGTEISIQVGKFLTFNSVIVSSVEPTFDARLDPNDVPIRAEVSLTFQSYEILTREALMNDVFKKVA